MKKCFYALKHPFFLLLVTLLCGTQMQAQQVISNESVMKLISENANKLMLTTDDQSNSRVSSVYQDNHTGLLLVYLQQTYKGVDVYNSIQTIGFKNGKAVSVEGTRVPKMIARANSQNALPAISSSDAVRIAAANVNVPVSANIAPLKTINDGRDLVFGKLGVSDVDVKARQMWVNDETTNQAKLTWQIEIKPNNAPDYWLVNVDALKGEVIGKDNITVYDNWGTPANKVAASNTSDKVSKKLEAQKQAFFDQGNGAYRVVAFPAESPNHPGGAPSLSNNPWELAGVGNNATTFKWNYDGTTTFDSTNGNNVLAQEDRNGNNGYGKGAHSTTAAPDLTFDYPPDFTQDPTNAQNQPFNITNLFYWNNIMHDFSYQYGFDEPSGNFQRNNMGRGGFGFDFVFADAQDGSGSNNANFSTPTDGNNPRMQMFLFNGSPKLDGDVDNGVISHEYTHGISNRLTGGPNNTSCLFNGEQMGEGWSDYFAIMVTTNWATAQVTDGANAHPVGTYVFNQPITGAGIRTYPYSTNFAIDPWTYAIRSNTGGESHNIGEIWTTVLWDMTWALIQNKGINTNIYDGAGTGGNNIAMNLVTTGLKLQKCSPGFVSGRDAILKADTLLYGGQYSCIIWDAFAKRGLGIYANEGSTNTISDGSADFTTPTGFTFTKHVDKDSAQDGEQLTYTFTVTTSFCGGIANQVISDTIPSNTTYVSGGTYNAVNRSVTFNNVTVLAGTTANYSFVVSVNSGSYFPPTTFIDEQVVGNSIPADWVNTSTTGTTWTVTNTKSHSAPNSFKAADLSSSSDEELTTVNSYNIEGTSILSFWHLYNCESGYDGGLVEISTDGGITWLDVADKFTMNGYSGTISSNYGSYIAGRKAFTGNSGGSAFINSTINLAAYAGKAIKIRFVFASDNVGGGDGWYVDDIKLTSAASVYNIASILDNNGVVKAVSDTVTYLKSGSLPVTWGNFTAEKQGITSLLKWNTLTEINADRFDIERSNDGTNFSVIGTVKASGNSNQVNNYTYTDSKPVEGMDYYRLREVDFDGHFSYSEVKNLNFGSGDNAIKISPNPAKEKISITVPGNTKELRISIVNAQGRQVKTFTMNGQYMQLQLPALASGVYYVRITGDGVSSNQKLVIE